MNGKTCPDVVNVEVRENFTLLVTFSDGTKKLCPLAQHLFFPPFRKLRNKAFFSLAHVGLTGCVSWPEDIDIAQEFFYYDTGTVIT